MKWILIVWFGHGLGGGSDILPIAYFDTKATCSEAQIALLEGNRHDRLRAECIQGYPITIGDRR